MITIEELNMLYVLLQRAPANTLEIYAANMVMENIKVLILENVNRKMKEQSTAAAKEETPQHGNV